MKHWILMATLAALICGLPTVAVADEHEDDDEDRYALALGFGLVELDNAALADDVETYLTAQFRIRFGSHEAHGGPADGGFRGYLEPEIGFWEASEGAFNADDTLLGVNLIGVMPMNAVDFFIGGGIGIHMLSADVPTASGVVTRDSDALGVNAQFGLDVHVSETASLFGVGRFDIVDDDSNSLDSKAYVGVRFYW